MAKRKKKLKAASKTENGGLFSGLSNFLPGKKQDQFLIGAAVGAAVTYVLLNEELREKLIASGIRLYAGLAGGLAEVKEQFADIKAEIDQETV
ncbi:hypothetical protein FACS1894205_1100 [Alphaproteobacteria bacterium]|nr:hypothetical protein FACS1894205_1100 [Alphaproteobacteria bacterium]